MNELMILNGSKRKEATHCLTIDMLTNEFVIKSIELRFNIEDKWNDLGANFYKTEFILSRLYELVYSDKTNIAFKATSYDLLTGRVLTNWEPTIIAAKYQKN